jgi:uncharacterized protein YkwD
MVSALMVDDGVLSRGHRENLMKESFTKIGIAVYSHKTYKYCCVLDFAENFLSFEENGRKE